MNIADIAKQAANLGNVIGGANLIGGNIAEALASLTWLLTPYKWIQGFTAAAFAGDHLLNHSFLSSVPAAYVK